MSGLGRFLELSVQTHDVLESLNFYKSLGFREMTVNDVWPHKYAVVSDGLICIGLHEREQDAPAVVTFVQKDLARHVLSMSDHGFEFTYTRLDDESFDEIGLLDNDRNAVSMVEARTFNFDEEDDDDSSCGTLFELTLPTRDAMRSAMFWGPVTRVVEEIREEPTVHMRFDAGGIPLGLSESIALERPSLCFVRAETGELRERIKLLGLEHKKYPGFEGARVQLTAPEGTPLFIFDEDFLGEAIEVEESDDTSSFPIAAIPGHDD